MASFTYNRKKFRELILYIADRCEDHNFFGATKLNKILFYSDFEALRQLGSPITGAEYQALGEGPCPVKLLPVQQELETRGDIEFVRRGKQKRTVALRDPDMSDFSEEEVEIIDAVIEDLRSLTAKETSLRSHEFLGWKAAIARGAKTTIPYETAFVTNRRPNNREMACLRASLEEHAH